MPAINAWYEIWGRAVSCFTRNEKIRTNINRAALFAGINVIIIAEYNNEKIIKLLPLFQNNPSFKISQNFI